MLGKQGIVIQGPTTFYKEIVKNYRGWGDNVIFSTWTSEPQEAIDYLLASNINVIVNQKPIFAGDLNINLQSYSTFKGLDYLHRKGVTEVLKVRSDVMVSDVKSLLEILQGRRLSYLAMANIAKRGDITYNLGYLHKGHDYGVDHIIYGDINDLMSMFNFQTDISYGVPPEALLMYNWMIAKNIPVNFDQSALKQNGVTFFLIDCLNKGIKINWLKRDQDLVAQCNSDYYLY